MNRKNIILFITVVITLFLSGCSENDNKDKSSKESIKTESEKINLKETEKKVTFIELGSVKCIPCKKMQPIMGEIKKEYGDQVEVVFYDVWTEQGKPYAEKYRIMVIPTQIFLDKDGNEYSRHTGFFPKDELVEVLKMKGVR